MDRIRTGDMVLPDFQRDSVWEPSATQALIVSIANNYSAGSILRVRDRQWAFSSREFEGAPAPTNEHTFLVLDGQQRLTSLYQAFYGVGDNRYYLDIRMLIDGAGFEDAIDYLRHSKSAVTRRAAFELQALFDVDPYDVLMAIALASGKTPSCKRGDVLNFTAEQATSWWQPVIDGLALSLTILHDDCWVLPPKWLPFNTMLSPMAAALARFGAGKGVAVGAQREQIKRWFWCSAFSQAYEKSPNTQSGRDVGELIPWLSDPATAAPEHVRQFRTNQRISCYAPSADMAELRDDPSFPMQAVLSSHLIPHVPESRQWSDDYERFLQQRHELVCEAISEMTDSR